MLESQCFWCENILTTMKITVRCNIVFNFFLTVPRVGSHITDYVRLPFHWPYVYFPICGGKIVSNVCFHLYIIGVLNYECFNSPFNMITRWCITTNWSNKLEKLDYQYNSPILLFLTQYLEQFLKTVMINSRVNFFQFITSKNPLS